MTERKELEETVREKHLWGDFNAGVRYTLISWR